MNMVPEKSICAIQEECWSSIDDCPDSPVSYSEEHVACCDEGPEIVFWSNAAFRTSLTSAICSNQEGGFSPRNRDSQNVAHNNNPIHCLSEKSISVNICKGNLAEISAQESYKMIKTGAQIKSPAIGQSSLPYKTSPLSGSNGKFRTLSGLNNGMIMSEEEMKIKAELEKEIENALEEEIKDDILVLTQRLAQLHAHQKVRKGERRIHASEFNTPLKSYNGALQDSKYPKLLITSFLGLGLSSSCREIKISAPDNGGRRLKSPGDQKDAEKKFQRDFDWVRSLRSGAKSNSPKKPNVSLADHEKLRNDFPRFSHALFSEPINEKKGSTKEKDEFCSSKHNHISHSAVCRKMDSRKGNAAVEEAKPVCQAEGKLKENRLLLIDMMNKFRGSDAYNVVGDQSKKRSILEKPTFSIEGLG